MGRIVTTESDINKMIRQMFTNMIDVFLEASKDEVTKETVIEYLKKCRDEYR